MYSLKVKLFYSLASFFFLVWIYLNYKVFFISSDSMLNTIKSGTWVVCNKSEVTNIDDIILFNYNNFNFIKRNKGQSGDTLRWEEQKLIINGVQEKIYETYKYTYMIDAKNLDKQNLDTVFNIPNLLFYSKNKFIYNGALYHFNNLSSLDGISVYPMYTKGLSDKMITINTNNLLLDWDCDFIVPYKGYTILMDTINIQIYGSTILNFENISYSINKYFTFTKDYCFVIGDNRMSSFDSRFFGFIPSKSVFGKMIFKF